MMVLARDKSRALSYHAQSEHNMHAAHYYTWYHSSMTIIEYVIELSGSQPVSYSQTLNLQLASNVVAYLSCHIGSKGLALGMHEL